MKKTVFFLFGTLICLVLLELGLRVFGYFYLSMRQTEDTEYAEKQKVYRILCYGDSMTANQYPKYLGEELKRRGIGLQFEVIDKGMPASKSDYILAVLEDDLRVYQPDMVITMMGINDTRNDPLFEYATKHATTNDLKKSVYSLKVFRLIQFIRPHILKRIKAHKQKHLDNENTNVQSVQTRKNKNMSESDLITKIIEYNKRGDYDIAEMLCISMIEKNRNNEWLYVHLSVSYLGSRKYKEAIHASKRALTLNMRNQWGLLNMAAAYCGLKEYDEAIAIYHQVLTRDKKNIKALNGLARCYAGKAEYFKENAQYQEMERMCQKAFAMDPNDEQAYLILGDYYIMRARYKDAIEVFTKAININPQSEHGLMQLGKSLSDTGDYANAEEVLKKAMVLNPLHEYLYVEAALCCEKQGKGQEAALLREKAMKIHQDSNLQNSDFFGFVYDKEQKKQFMVKKFRIHEQNKGFVDANIVTEYYCRKIMRIVADSNVQLVCVQYPMRNLGLLKGLFEPSTEVVFVDNEGIFKKVVEREGYEQYFTDRFAGDFGHCTKKGNQLLARNIADAIIIQVFHQ